MANQRQEIWCHACQNYVQFTMDLSLDGNHVLNCPNCGHEHCRVVRRGVITGDRWDQRNGPIVPVSNITYTSTSTNASYLVVATDITGGFLLDSWTSTSNVSSF
jgi:hypothetical protein